MPKPKAPGSTPSARDTLSQPQSLPGTTEVQSVPPSLFRPGDDNIVRGEVLVKLSQTSAREVTSSIPTGPLGGRTFGLPTGFGISEVDEILGRYGARAIVRLHHPPSPSTAAADEQLLGQTYRVRLEAGADIAAAARALSESGAVAEATPNRWREGTVFPNDPDFPTQWGLTRIDCPAAWDRTVGTPAVVVGVIDTGVDLDHPELAALLLPGQDTVDLAGIDPPAGTHFEGDWMVRDDVPQDEVGHGTHVAGTIACASNNAAGVAGVTWQCSILPVKVLTRVVENDPPHRVRGVGSAADIAAGIRWAVDHGARVINMSLGGYGDTFVERDAVAYAVASGVVVVAAMGNDNTSTPSYPAAYPGVLAVGATTPADARAPFSNFGPHIGVAAPGVDVLSTVWNDGYTTMSGTSMASPHAAGVAALVLSVNPALTAEEVRNILRETARPLRDNPSDPVPNDNYGSGLIDAAASVARAAPIIPPTRPTMLTIPTQPTRPTLPTNPTRPTALTFPTRPTLPTFPTQPTRPTFPTNPTAPTFPTRPTLPTFPTQPTRPTFPTNPTAPTFPTRPTRPTFPTNPTAPTFPTRPTRPTFPTRPTLPTFPTRPTLPTFPTRPTLPTFPTRPTLPTFPTRPTFPTNPTAPTFPTRPTRPTLPTFPTRPTLPTFPTRPTLPTFPTRPTRPTLPTFPTRPTFPTNPTAPTFPTRPTRPTFPTEPTRPTRPTIPTVGTRPTIPGTIDPGPFGYTGYEGYQDPYATAGYEGYQDPYAQTGYEGYEDPSAGYYDPYAQTGYEGYEDPYAGYYDPYATGYESYDPYGGYYDPYAQTGYEGYEDPYAGYYDPYATGYESYDPYGGYYDPYAQTGYEGYEDPNAGYYDPYGGYA